MTKLTKYSFSNNFLFYILLFIAPFIYYIKYTVYGFFNAEVVLLLVSLIVVAFIITQFEKLFGWVGHILIATAAIVICLSFLPYFKTNTTVLLVFFIALVLNVFLENHIRTILSIMLVVFIFSTLVFPIKHQMSSYTEHHFPVKQPRNNDLPPVIHLMLDEHAGIDGIPTNIAQGKELQTELESVYNKNGFHIYGAAYSHYVQTFNSVSNLINFSNKPESHYYFKHNSRLTQNTYFKLMAQKGYRIRVYQFNRLIDYCEPDQYPIESCFDYPAANLNSIKGLGFSTKDKFLFILKSYLLWSHVYAMFQTSYQYYLAPTLSYFGVDIPSWGWYQARTSAILIPVIFQQIAHDVKQHPYGTFFYAHILGPHNPYVYDANCQLIKNPRSWEINISADPVMNTAETRIERYTLYENQVRCVTKQVQMLLADLKQAGIYKKTIIIVNGDHGSRITENLPVEKLKKQFSLQSYRDCFNAFFAVKMPGIAASTSFETKSIQQLLAKVVNKITGSKISIKATNPYVYMLTPGYHGKMMPLYYDQLLKSKPNT